MNNTFPKVLIDRFQRRIDYVRLSITDRCDFRCVYCMAEEMTFAPKQHVLTLEEIQEVARAFVELGISSINISLDSLQARRFRQLTRYGNLDQVIAGIDAAIAARFDRIRLNAVILKGRNEDEVLDLVDFAVQRNIDIAFIEEMPLGLIDEHNRALSFCSSDDLRAIITTKYTLQALGDPQGNPEDKAGPARYFHTGTGPTRIGFISPHSNNFCHLCNRVRVTAEGQLLLCLGNEHSVDLRAVLRAPHYSIDTLKHAIVDGMAIKPERHHFDLDETPDIVRFMNTTGG